MDKARFGGFAALLAGATMAAACGGGGGAKDARAPLGSAPVGTAGGAQCAFASAASPIGHTGSGSTLALAKIGGKRVAYVADEDAKAIVTIDLESKQQLAETSLGATPAQVYVAKDGRIFVTLRDRDELAVLEATQATAPLTRRCAAKTAPEPIGIGASLDDRVIAITSGWGQTLTAFDGSSLGKRHEMKLPREPRSVVVSDDGKHAFVSHAVGTVMTEVTLGERISQTKPIALRGHLPGELQRSAQQKARAAKMIKSNPGMAKEIIEQLEAEKLQMRRGRESCQGFALAKSEAIPGRIFAPQVFVDPGDPERRPDGYGDENRPTELPSIAVVDEGAGEPLESSLAMDVHGKSGRLPDPRDPRPECLLPRAAAVDPHTRSLLVTCFGIDAVVAYDATSANPMTSERRRWTVGSGPSGIAIDAEKRRGVVWSQFDRTLSTFAIGGTELVDEKAAPLLVQKTALAPLKEKLPAEYALGRILFHAAGDARVSGDGRACASCHPDGRDDAITWATPEGPRRSIMLAGRVSAGAPYSWNGNESTIHNHLGNTFDRLSGKGLRSIELDALVAYLSKMPAPPQVAQDKAKADRGRQIFTSSEAGCASCHAGATFSDGKNHDVGSKHKADRSSEFNTPSLHLVGGTGPYFHDGRYATLGDLLRASDNTMGKTKHLSPADLEALETYLRSL